MSDVDIALIEAVALALGSISIGDQKRQEGLDSVLSYLRDSFLANDNKTAAAVIETVRKKATDFSSGPAAINALIERKGNPGSSH
jgi:hypothetical protein